mmetsp:Transcript_5669/g.11725  ORF Transcript_5669/g.11725 Transcript_5669/m.11725 type:complete len:218 (-) Transcript_5669:328-981(-)
MRRRARRLRRGRLCRDGRFWVGFLRWGSIHGLKTEAINDSDCLPHDLYLGWGKGIRCHDLARPRTGIRGEDGSGSCNQDGCSSSLIQDGPSSCLTRLSKVRRWIWVHDVSHSKSIIVANDNQCLVFLLRGRQYLDRNNCSNQSFELIVRCSLGEIASYSNTCSSWSNRMANIGRNNCKHLGEIASYSNTCSSWSNRTMLVRCNLMLVRINRPMKDAI